MLLLFLLPFCLYHFLCFTAAFVWQHFMLLTSCLLDKILLSPFGHLVFVIFATVFYLRCFFVICLRYLISVPIGYCAAGRACGQRFGLMHFLYMCMLVWERLPNSPQTCSLSLALSPLSAICMTNTNNYNSNNNINRNNDFGKSGNLFASLQIPAPMHTNTYTFIHTHRHSFHNYTSAWVHLIGSYTVFACMAHTSTQTYTNTIFYDFLYVCALSCTAAAVAAVDAAAATAAGHCLCCYRTSCGSFVVCIIYACNKTLSSCIPYPSCSPTTNSSFSFSPLVFAYYLPTWFVSFSYLLLHILWYFA